MFLVLLVCAAPVIASYVAYFLIRPDARTNYSELIQPPRRIPANLALTDLQGRPVKAESLTRQWLLIVVSGGNCDGGCEHRLWLQRQLREALGRESERLDKLWLITDDAAPRPELFRALMAAVPPTVLRVPPAAIAAWLVPAPGHRLDEHMFIVDPLGDWMMRVPPEADPSQVRRDLDRLMRGSAGWDLPGR